MLLPPCLGIWLLGCLLCACLSTVLGIGHGTCMMQLCFVHVSPCLHRLHTPWLCSHGPGPLLSRPAILLLPDALQPICRLLLLSGHRCAAD